MENKNSRNTGYWVATGILSAGMALTALSQDLPRNPNLAHTIAHLGYPPYFPFLVGTGKLCGAIALLVPRNPILKEWAYAGFTILFVSAFFSHLASGDGPMAAAPLIALAILGTSYFLRPKESRVSSGTRPLRTQLEAG